MASLMLFLVFIANLKTLVIFFLGSLWGAISRILFPPDDHDTPSCYSDLESGLLVGRIRSIPQTTFMPFVRYGILGYRRLTFSPYAAYNSLETPKPKISPSQLTPSSAVHSNLFVDLPALKVEHRIKMVSTGQRHIPLSPGNTKSLGRLHMTGRQLGRCAFPPEARGDDFRKWTLVMRTLFSSSSTLQRQKNHDTPDIHNVSDQVQKPVTVSESCSSTKPDKVKIPGTKLRITRAKPGVRRLARSMDRNAVYQSGKMPLPLPTMPAPIPYPPAPPPSPSRLESTLCSDRANVGVLLNTAGFSVVYIHYTPSPQERLWKRNQMSTVRSV